MRLYGIVIATSPTPLQLVASASSAGAEVDRPRLHGRRVASGRRGLERLERARVPELHAPAASVP